MSLQDRIIFLEELAALGMLPPALAGVLPPVREELARLAEVTS